ncbi:MAG: thiamine-phosphate kinase [Methylocystaceae bacterium]|nr:thiamine-phosphate kinase [Methylocystaceae bacterium]
MLGEFEQIAQIMAPLAQKAKGAFGLKDDAAVFQVNSGDEMVVTTDTLIAGVHFFADDPAETIAHKLLAVNLSDLAAMGAQPRYYTLNTSYPSEVKLDWIKQFANGLKQMQDEYGIILLGGDTTRTPGPLCLSVTAFGCVPERQALKRTTARVGDLICVSNTIGDGALGLLVAQGKIEDKSGHLLKSYRRPIPRTKLGPKLVGLATSCMDISDGLLSDFGHMGVGGEIDLAKIPLSPAAQQVLAEDSTLFPTILNGGDDYELLFCIDPKDKDRMLDTGETCDCQISVIGRITEGYDLVVLDETAQKVDIKTNGYRHF